MTRPRRSREELRELGLGLPPENLPRLEPGSARRTIGGDVAVEELDLGRRRDRRRFLDVPRAIYRGDPHYVAPLRISLDRFLDPAVNPAFANLEVRALVAVRDGRDVGRLTAHVDHAWERHYGERAGCFGFFESVDEPAVAHALLADAVEWLRRQGCREVFGPLSFTTNHQAGLLVENFERPPWVEQGYNPPYYAALLEGFGLGRAKDLLVWWIDVRRGLDSERRRRVARIADKIVAREGLTVRHLDRDHVDRDLEVMYELYTQAWQDNWGFVPLERAEYDFLVEDLKRILIPELLLFVEVGGRPVGFCCTIPNINEKLPRNGRLLPFGWLRLLGGLRRTDTGRLYTLGMLQEYRKRGLESILFVETALRCQRLGPAHGEIGWTLEDNHLINRAVESMDGRLDRRYRIYGGLLG